MVNGGMVVDCGIGSHKYSYLRVKKTCLKKKRVRTGDKERCLQGHSVETLHDRTRFQMSRGRKKVSEEK